MVDPCSWAGLHGFEETEIDSQWRLMGADELERAFAGGPAAFVQSVACQLTVAERAARDLESNDLEAPLQLGATRRSSCCLENNALEAPVQLGAQGLGQQRLGGKAGGAKQTGSLQATPQRAPKTSAASSAGLKRKRPAAKNHTRLSAACDAECS